MGQVEREPHGPEGMTLRMAWMEKVTQMTINKYLWNYGWEAAQLGMVKADGIGCGLEGGWGG